MDASGTTSEFEQKFVQRQTKGVIDYVNRVTIHLPAGLFANLPAEQD